MMRRMSSHTHCTTCHATGKTCLHYAAAGGHLATVVYLVTRGGASAVMAMDETRRIPLFYGQCLGSGGYA